MTLSIDKYNHKNIYKLTAIQILCLIIAAFKNKHNTYSIFYLRYKTITVFGNLGKNNPDVIFQNSEQEQKKITFN